jgi:hypothetical protein
MLAGFVAALATRRAPHREAAPLIEKQNEGWDVIEVVARVALS